MLPNYQYVINSVINDCHFAALSYNYLCTKYTYCFYFLTVLHYLGVIEIITDNSTIEFAEVAEMGNDYKCEVAAICIRYIDCLALSSSDYQRTVQLSQEGE